VPVAATIQVVVSHVFGSNRENSGAGAGAGDLELISWDPEELVLLLLLLVVVLLAVAGLVEV
jgi:hypothetical protein